MADDAVPAVIAPGEMSAKLLARAKFVRPMTEAGGRQQGKQFDSQIRLGLLRLFDMDLLDQVKKIHVNMSFVDDCVIITLERLRDGELLAFKVPNTAFVQNRPIDFLLDDLTRAKIVLFLA